MPSDQLKISMAVDAESREAFDRAVDNSTDCCPVAQQGGWRDQHWRARTGEMAGIFLLFLLYAGSAPPAVNEAHYLSKARHYWQPTWAMGDLFLESLDAHGVFYWLLGWLTACFPLPVAAWLARSITWVALAAGWQRLSYVAAPWRGLSLWTAAVWLVLLEYGAMAGEWVVGGVEAKGLSYACVFWALSRFIRQRWSSGLLILGLATSCHVLVGGWSLVLAVMAWLSVGKRRQPLLHLLPAAAGAVLLALPGLWPALGLTRGQDPVVVLESNWIYVFARLPHHLLFHALRWQDILAHGALLLTWLAVGMLTPCHLRSDHLGQRPLRGFVGGAVLLAIVGAVLDQLWLSDWELAATFLKYYWFRLSDAMLPAGVALATGAALMGWRTARPRLANLGLLLIGLFALAANLHHARHSGLLSPEAIDLQMTRLADLGWLPRTEVSRVTREWRETCRWIGEHTPTGTRFLTPRNQMTFKWYAGRAEAVNVKDIPQDARHVILWQDRRELLYPPNTGPVGLLAHEPQRLLELARQFQCDYIVLDYFLARNAETPVELPDWPLVYQSADDQQSASFLVLKIPPPEASAP